MAQGTAQLLARTQRGLFGPVTVAKAYRLLRRRSWPPPQIDQTIRRNPCRIENAGKEDSPERQIAPLPVVFSIAESVPARYRMLALLATFAGLRRGELDRPAPRHNIAPSTPAR